MSDALIHLRLPAASKGRWVRASRAAGMRLTDWIVDAVEAHMQQQLTKLSIPENIEFSSLKIERDPSDGSITFEWSVIEKICKANNLQVEIFRDAPEENITRLITSWHSEHVRQGGKPDPVIEDINAEVMAEERAEQTFSYPPGRS